MCVPNTELHVFYCLAAEVECVGRVVAGSARAVNIGDVKRIVDELVCRGLVRVVRPRVAALVAALRA
jgi:hypothetical protein